MMDRATLVPAVAAILPEALRFYLDTHMHPELSGAEQETAARFVDVLRRHHLQVVDSVGGHGVVGVLPNGPGRTVLIRAELDALPVHEATGLRYASTRTAIGPDGRPTAVMHACGHDAHLAALAGTAAVLAEQREHWHGTVIVVGQPAEEVLTGAAAMLADRLYDRFGLPDAALAQHLAPFEAGRVAHGRVMLGASRSLRVTVGGVGGHTADPASTTNPIESAAALVDRLRDLCTADSVVACGAIHGGLAPNVVPETVSLDLVVRATDSVRVATAVTALEALVASICAPHWSAVDQRAESLPTVVDSELGGALRQAHVSALGPSAVLPWRTSMATDDFPVFGAGGLVPIGYWMLGCVGRRTLAAIDANGIEAKLARVPPNHSPRFAPDPAATLRTGITAMVSATLSAMAGTSGQWRDRGL